MSALLGALFNSNEGAAPQRQTISLPPISQSLTCIANVSRDDAIVEELERLRDNAPSQLPEWAEPGHVSQLVELTKHRSPLVSELAIQLLRVVITPSADYPDVSSKICSLIAPQAVDLVNTAILGPASTVRSTEALRILSLMMGEPSVMQIVHSAIVGENTQLGKREPRHTLARLLDLLRYDSVIRTHAMHLLRLVAECEASDPVPLLLSWLALPDTYIQLLSAVMKDSYVGPLVDDTYRIIALGLAYDADSCIAPFIGKEGLIYMASTLSRAIEPGSSPATNASVSSAIELFNTIQTTLLTLPFQTQTRVFSTENGRRPAPAIGWMAVGTALLGLTCALDGSLIADDAAEALAVFLGTLSNIKLDATYDIWMALGGVASLASARELTVSLKNFTENSSDVTSDIGRVLIPLLQLRYSLPQLQAPQVHFQDPMECPIFCLFTLAFNRPVLSPQLQSLLLALIALPPIGEWYLSALAGAYGLPVPAPRHRFLSILTRMPVANVFPNELGTLVSTHINILNTSVGSPLCLLSFIVAVDSAACLRRKLTGDSEQEIYARNSQAVSKLLDNLIVLLPTLPTGAAALTVALFTMISARVDVFDCSTPLNTSIPVMLSLQQGPLLLLATSFVAGYLVLSPRAQPTEANDAWVTLRELCEKCGAETESASAEQTEAAFSAITACIEQAFRDCGVSSVPKVVTDRLTAGVVAAVRRDMFSMSTLSTPQGPSVPPQMPPSPSLKPTAAVQQSQASAQQSVPSAVIGQLGKGISSIGGFMKSYITTIGRTDQVDAPPDPEPPVTSGSTPQQLVTPGANSSSPPAQYEASTPTGPQQPLSSLLPPAENAEDFFDETPSKPAQPQEPRAPQPVEQPPCSQPSLEELISLITLSLSSNPDWAAGISDALRPYVPEISSSTTSDRDEEVTELREQLNSKEKEIEQMKEIIQQQEKLLSEANDVSSLEARVKELEAEQQVLFSHTQLADDYIAELQLLLSSSGIDIPDMPEDL